MRMILAVGLVATRDDGSKANNNSNSFKLIDRVGSRIGHGWALSNQIFQGWACCVDIDVLRLGE